MKLEKKRVVLNCVFLFLFVLAIALLIFIFGNQRSVMKNKTVWTYWDTPETMPEIVDICVKRMEKYIPGYAVVVLNKNNYNQYVSIPNYIANHKNYNDSHARFSDLIRLSVLAEKGGIWIDASILLNSEIKFDFEKYEFCGFYLQSFTRSLEYPVIESWFFGCGQNRDFIKKWKNEFYEMAKFNSVSEYVKSRREMGVDFQNIDNLEYLAIHIAAQKVLQIDKYPIDRFLLEKAEDTAYKYLFYDGYDPNDNVQVREEKGLRSIVDTDYKIVKIRGAERGIMNNDPVLKEKIINKYKI